LLISPWIDTTPHPRGLLAPTIKQAKNVPPISLGQFHAELWTAINTMDPQIIAAMIGGVATVGSSIFEKWRGKSDTREDAGLDEKLDEHYDTLRALLTDHCVAILKRLENGQNHSPQQIIPFVYSQIQFPSHVEERYFETEFEYRLQYLTTVGVLTRPTSEYYITPLGMAFLRKAREKRDYYEIFR
jgi:hypothetical protein